MPSFEHEIVVQLFRNRPALAGELLRACADIELAAGLVEAASIDLSQVVSTEYRADHVVVVRDESQTALAAVIVEVQRRTDRDKEYSWPVYVTALRTRLRCPVILLVIAASEPIARWARGTLDTGHPGFSLAPVVTTLADVPRITDPELALRSPEMSLLSAIAHPELEIVHAALAAICALPDERSRLYLDVLVDAHPKVIVSILESHMRDDIPYRSEFARKYYAQGREEGREEAAIALARAKLESFSEVDAQRVRSLSDATALTNLIVALGEARDAAEARRTLDRLAPATAPD